MKRKRSPIARGFTLIELMIVAAIIGVLASVALPEFQLMMIRSKVAEREPLVKRIVQGVQDLYLRQGQIPAASQNGAATPPPPPGNMKRVADWNQAGWKDIFSSMGGASGVDGTVYYTYQYTALEPAGTLQIDVWGDLDGDGVQTHKQYFYVRIEGAYVQTLPLPGTPNPEDLGIY